MRSFVARCRPRAAAIAVTASLVLAVPAAGGVAAATGGAPAHAAAPRDGVGAASAKVQRILARVHALSVKVRTAEQRYAAALGNVAAGVNEAISADRGQAAVRDLVASSQQRLQQQILALYASGGSFATAASLLAPDGLTEFTASTHAVTAAVTQTEQLERQRQALAAAAGRVAARSNRTAAHSIATARSVAGVARRVQTLLAEQQTLLARAQQELAHQKDLAAQRAALAAEAAQFTSDTTAGVTAVGVLPPSAEYLKLYKGAAATCSGLRWTVLAAIGQVESGHGRNPGTSSAGAQGPMQFEPATFASYAVDGDHDGKTNIMDPADAIYTAAHYLCANGAGRGPEALAHAIWDYNHAGWYVQLVLGLAQKYDGFYR